MTQEIAKEFTCFLFFVQDNECRHGAIVNSHPAPLKA